jgi:hypothetical protein
MVKSSDPCRYNSKFRCVKKLSKGDSWGAPVSSYGLTFCTTGKGNRCKDKGYLGAPLKATFRANPTTRNHFFKASKQRRRLKKLGNRVKQAKSKAKSRAKPRAKAKSKKRSSVIDSEDLRADMAALDSKDLKRMTRAEMDAIDDAHPALRYNTRQLKKMTPAQIKEYDAEIRAYNDRRRAVDDTSLANRLSAIVQQERAALAARAGKIHDPSGKIELADDGFIGFQPTPADAGPINVIPVRRKVPPLT